MTEKALADELRAWRRSHTVGQAAACLGVPLRTLNGIEQGRGFRYEQLLRLAMKATEIGGDHGTAK